MSVVLVPTAVIQPCTGALRSRRRTGPAGDQPQEAGIEEPRVAGDRGCHRNAGDQAAGLRSSPHCQRTEEARAHSLPCWRALCVAAPRPETMNKRLKALEAKSAHLVLTEAQGVALE